MVKPDMHYLPFWAMIDDWPIRKRQLADAAAAIDQSRIDA